MFNRMVKSSRWSRFGLALTFLLSLAACTHGEDLKGGPVDTLKGYINKSLDVKSAEDRKILTGYLTGEAKTRFASWSDEQFRQAFIESKRQYIKLLIKEVKNSSPTEANITYEFTYLDQSRGENAKVTNKKLCTVVQAQGKWLISDVRNIKELVEFQREMTLP